MLRSYAGGVPEVLLTAPITDLATSATVSTVLGMPDGSNGPFAVVIGKATPNEEKVLVSSAGGGTLTFSQRGYDGTAARPHADGEEVRMVITSIDAAEANAHVNASSGVHGLDLTDAVAGVNTPQTFVNKELSGLQNVISNIAIADSPELLAAFAAEEAARLLGDGVRYTKTEADLLFPTIAVSQAYADAAVLDHTEALDPHIQYQTKVAAAAEALTYLPLVNSGLDPADVPEAHTGRRWSGGVDPLTGTDVDPTKVLGSITIPAASGPGQAGGLGTRLIKVQASIKGFTSNGSDSDVSRFQIQLHLTGNGDWWGHAGEPQVNGRIPGNVSVGANGIFIEGMLDVPFAQSATVQLRLVKISGVNPSNVGDSDCFFTAVQLV